MKWIIGFIVFSLCSLSLFSQEINENALKYFNILKAKPTPGFMFDRFYGAWMESSDTKSLEEYLKKLSIETPSSENYLLLAFYYQKEGQNLKALNVFGSIENEKLLSAEVLFYQAKLESNTFNYVDAIIHIDKALAMPQKDTLKQNLLKLKAQAQYRNGDGTAAKKTFEDLHKLNEKDKSLIEDIVELQLEEGMLEEAKGYCEKLLDLASDNYERAYCQLKLSSIFKRLNEIENAEKIYVDLIKLSGQDGWLLKEVLFQFEAIYRGKDDLDGLVNQYKELIQLNPQNVFLHKKYSALLAEKGEKENSIKEFQLIVELLPGDRNIKEEYANLLVTNDKLEEAVKILEAIASIQPGKKDFEIIFRIMELEFKDKKLKKAYQLVEAYLSKEELTEYEILRVGALVQKNDEVAKAIEFYEKLSKKKPDFVSLKEVLIGLYLENNQKEQALQSLNLFDLKENFDLNIRMTNLLIKYKFIDEALLILEKLNKENKDSFRAQKKKYEIYVELKDDAKIKALFTTIVQASSSINEIREAIQLIRSHLKDQALIDFIKFLESKQKLDEKEILLLANLKYKTEQQEEALKLIDDNLTRFSESPIYLEMAEDFYTIAKDYDRSLKAIELIIKKSPKENARYLLLKTNLLRRAKRIEEAIEAGKLLVIATNNKVENVIMLADLYSQNDESAKALELLRKSSFANPESKELKLELSEHYLYAQNYKDSRRIIWSLIESTEDVSDKINYLTSLINSYEDDLGLEPLIENLKERRKSNSKSIFPLLGLVRVYQRMDDNENKTKYLIELSQLKSDDVKLYIEIANVMLTDMNYEGAENAFQKALGVDKTDQTRKKYIQYLLTAQKVDQALNEFKKISGKQADENEILEMADKLLDLEDPEKAYLFLKSNPPVNKTYQYQYLLAFTAAYAKKEEARDLLLALLDIKEEFGKNTFVPFRHRYNRFDYCKKFVPKIINELWEFSSYLDAKRNGYYPSKNYQYASSQISTLLPADLKDLQNSVIIQLSEIYKISNEAKKAELLSLLMTKNIEYPLLKLRMQDREDRSIYKELFEKYPENKEYKLLNIIYEKDFFRKLNEKLLSSIKELKTIDATYAYWLALLYSPYLKEVKQEYLDEIEDLIVKVKPTEAEKLDLYLSIFGGHEKKVIPLESKIIEAYKDRVLGLMDKNINRIIKENDENLINLLGTSIYRLNDPARYAKFINLQNNNIIKSSNNYNSQNYYRRHSRYRGYRSYSNNSNSFMFVTQYPEIIFEKIKSGSLISKDIDKDFVLKVLPLIEDKLLQLAIYNQFENKVEEEKAIIALTADKNVESLQIAAAYYVDKKKNKEAIEVLKLMLLLPMDVDKKKEVNENIIYYASQGEDQALLQESLAAVQRLKNYSLSKEELLSLSTYLEAMGASEEAEKLDIKSKKIKINNLSTNLSKPNTSQTFEEKLGFLIDENKKEAAFKQMISFIKKCVSINPSIIKNRPFYEMEMMNDYVSPLVSLVKKKKVMDNLKEFISQQPNTNIEDLMASAFLLFLFEEKEDCHKVLQRMIEKAPQELFYKLLQYIVNISKEKELNAELQKCIIEAPNDCIAYLTYFSTNENFFKIKPMDFKNIFYFLLEKTNIKSSGDENYEVSLMLAPFANNDIFLTDPPNKNSNGDDDEVVTLNMTIEDIKEYRQYFLDLMGKCLKKKHLAYYAGSILMQYYFDNGNDKITEEQLQQLKTVMIEAHNAEKFNFQQFRSARRNHRSENVFPLFFNLTKYYLENDKVAEVDKLVEQITGEEKEKYKKFVDNFKKLFIDTEINKEIIEEISSSITMDIPEDFLTTLFGISKIVKYKNKRIHELIFSTIKNYLEDENNDIDYRALQDYVLSQILNMKKEEALNYFLELEKKLLPKPFDKKEIENTKEPQERSAQTAIYLFGKLGENFEIFKQYAFASKKSEFYHYVLRYGNININEYIIKESEILNSNFLEVPLEELPIIQFRDSREFFMQMVLRGFIRKFSEKKILGILEKRQQTDGIKLISIWAKKNSFKESFEFLGEKIESFKAMPITLQIEWVAFLNDQYTTKDKTKLSEKGKAFVAYIKEIEKKSTSEKMNKFLNNDLVEFKNNPYEFFRILDEIYPALLEESSEKFSEIIKSLHKKYNTTLKNENDDRDEDEFKTNYFKDEFITRILYQSDCPINQLIITTELLSEKKNWDPSYYEEYSRGVKNYIHQTLKEFMDKNNIAMDDNGVYFIKNELHAAFQLEFNKIIENILSVNNNKVPLFIQFGYAEFFYISNFNSLIPEVLSAWSKDKKLAGIKKDIVMEIQYNLDGDKTLLQDYYVAKIKDKQVINQIKKYYIQEILSRSIFDKAVKDQMLPYQLSILKSEGVNQLSNYEELINFFNTYEYETILKSKDDISKMIKNWMRGFEKNILDAAKGNNNAYKLRVNYLDIIENKIKFLKFLKESVGVESLKKVYFHNSFEFSQDLATYLQLVKKGFGEDLPGAIDSLITNNLDRSNISSYLPIEYEDLPLLEQLISKVSDVDKQKLSRLVAYRYGVTQSYLGVSLQVLKGEIQFWNYFNNDYFVNYDYDQHELFKKYLKEFIKEPNKDPKINSILLSIIFNTTMIEDAEIQQFFKSEIENFRISDLKVLDAKTQCVFKMYCQILARRLISGDFEAAKKELEQILIAAKKNYNFESELYTFVFETFMQTFKVDKNLLSNAAHFYEIIQLLFDHKSYHSYEIFEGFNLYLNFLFLSGNGKNLEKWLDKYSPNSFYNRGQDLSINEAIEFFKNAYLQNQEHPELVIQYLEEFLKSELDQYYSTTNYFYDYSRRMYLNRSDIEINFDFIKNKVDRQRIEKCYKLFSEKEKPNDNKRQQWVGVKMLGYWWLLLGKS